MAVRDYEFDQFRLTPELCELTRAGRPVRLEKIPFDLLVLLVEHRNELVSREVDHGCALGKWRVPGSGPEPQHGGPEGAPGVAGQRRRTAFYPDGRRTRVPVCRPRDRE